MGCFNPILRKIWTNPAVGLKIKCNPMAGFVHIGLKLGENNPALGFL